MSNRPRGVRFQGRGFSLFIAATLGALVWAPLPVRAEGPGDVAKQILAMTGARTKIVWVHKVVGGPSGWDATGPDYELKVFDTTEGKARVLLPGPAHYANPCISGDGKVVFYSLMAKKLICRVNWDGGGKRVFGKGYALCSWQSPADGSQWLYFTADGYVKGPLIRARIDDPNVREVMWDNPSAEASHTLTVSADGTRAGGEFPWPLAGVAIMPKVTWKQYGNGCNASLAPDNSYRMMHMGEQAAHSGVMMYDDGGLNKRVIRFSGTGLPGRGPREECWVPRWTTDARFFTTNSPIGGPKSEIYLGQFDDKFTKVVKWVRVTYEARQDAKAACWIDPGLGQFSGEAPLIIQTPAHVTPGEGWRWDFGDLPAGKAGGTKSAAGKHTYTKPGNYAITARRGDIIVKGRVNARPRKAPSVTGASLLDETRMRVSFDERVQLKDAKISLKSGTPVRSAKVDAEGMNVIVKLGGKLPAGDTLSLTGVFDRAQVPNPVEGPARIARPAWPGERDGLVFLWEGNQKPSFQYHPGSDTFNNTKILSRGNARFGRFGEMFLGGGVMSAVDGGRGIVARCRKSNELTIEAVVQPANVHQGWLDHPRSIIACGSGGGRDGANFRLGQEGRKLVLYLRHKPPEAKGRPPVTRVQLCTIGDRGPSHVVVSYKSGELVCYLNGEQVARTDKVKGALPWSNVSFERGLNFGGEEPWVYPTPGWAVHGQRPDYPVWRGKLEGVAIYARAAGAVAAAKNYAAYKAILAKRPVPARVHLRGTLTAKSRVPRAKDIAPYRDALVVYEYDVTKVLRGKYAGKRIRVARWGLLNARPAPVSRAKIGEKTDLVVEAFKDHPQLGAEVTSDTLEANFDLERYVDVSNGPTGEPRLDDIRVRPWEVWMGPGEKQKFTATTLDQYRCPIDVPLSWSIVRGGRISTGAYYGGAVYVEHKAKGDGKIDADGLFVSDGTIGVVTIVAAGPEGSGVKGNGRVAVDNYPAIAPWNRYPLHIGAGQGGSRGFDGDIDRARIYRCALTEKEIVANGKGKLTDRKLIADWTFDKVADGAFANQAGDGLTAKIVGDVKHLKHPGGGFIRLTPKWGSVVVAHDKRLILSHACTLEAWIRPREGDKPTGVLFDKAVGGAPIGFLVTVNGGLSSFAMHGWLEKYLKYPQGVWSHVAVVFDVRGARRHYLNGKLVAEHKPKVKIVIK